MASFLIATFGELNHPPIRQLELKILINKICFCRVFLIFAVTIGAANGAEPAASGYDSLIQQGKSQLQAGNAEQAAASGKAATKMSTERWEGYALVGGALMNLKRYEAAADTLSEAIKRAPEAKQAALRELRRQCLLAESGPPAVANTPAPATTTSQAEIVLWKSIEGSTNPADFESYLDQYPQGAFAVLARRHLSEAKDKAELMNFVRDSSNAQGQINYVSYAHDSAKEKDWTTTLSRELRIGNIQNCDFGYHIKATRNGQVTRDADIVFSLRDVQDVIVETLDEVFKASYIQEGHLTISNRVEPRVFAVLLRRPGNVLNEIDFREEELANRVAKALAHAVDLCGGAKKKEPDSAVKVAPADTRSELRAALSQQIKSP